MQGIKRFVAAGAVAALVAVPATAVAQESSFRGYKHRDIVVVDESSSTKDSGTTAVASTPSGDGDDPGGSSGGSLPFSGLDVGLLAAAGAGLVALGAGMRRLTRRPDTA